MFEASADQTAKSAFMNAHVARAEAARGIWAWVFAAFRISAPEKRFSRWA